MCVVRRDDMNLGVLLTVLLRRLCDTPPALLTVSLICWWNLRLVGILTPRSFCRLDDWMGELLMVYRGCVGCV